MNYVYSQIFETMHDEKKAVGNIGNGSHYSVLRTPSWFDDCKLLLKEPMIQDFAIIWDKDHDCRVIEFVEHMYMKNLLSPVLFVGERNKHLSVLVSPLLKETLSELEFEAFVFSVVELAKNQYEPCTAEVCVYGDTQSVLQIIDSSRENVELYLKNIHMLLDLGLKDFRVGLCKSGLLTNLIDRY